MGADGDDAVGGLDDAVGRLLFPLSSRAPSWAPPTTGTEATGTTAAMTAAATPTRRQAPDPPPPPPEEGWIPPTLEDFDFSAFVGYFLDIGLDDHYDVDRWPDSPGGGSPPPPLVDAPTGRGLPATSWAAAARGAGRRGGDPATGSGSGALRCPVCSEMYPDYEDTHPNRGRIPEYRCSHGATIVFAKIGCCPVCLDDDVSPPNVVLPCGHVLCKEDFGRLGGMVGKRPQNIPPPKKVVVAARGGGRANATTRPARLPQQQHQEHQHQEQHQDSSSRFRRRRRRNPRGGAEMPSPADVLSSIPSPSAVRSPVAYRSAAFRGPWYPMQSRNDVMR
jgi:hypothetical protein